ncbi:hypothetical protein GCM10009757_29800 [Streptomyces cheonanensis]|uniref:Uncharacterized protein n=1 Tax=Streptomyces cheonanensis TaxID=312720 RepID=A0ABN2V7K0_9ACTN
MTGTWCGACAAAGAGAEGEAGARGTGGGRGAGAAHAMSSMRPDHPAPGAESAKITPKSERARTQRQMRQCVTVRFHARRARTPGTPPVRTALPASPAR